MSDMELIMQLARLEEHEEEEDRLGEDGVTSLVGVDKDPLGQGTGPSDVDALKISNVAATSSSRSGGVGGTSDVFRAKNGIATDRPCNPNNGNEELKALADLEKELGLDDLQLFLDSSPTPAISNFKSPEGRSGRSDTSMGVETGGSVTSFNTAATGFNSSQKVDENDDDENLDELERYLESLSAPSPNK